MFRRYSFIVLTSLGSLTAASPPPEQKAAALQTKSQASVSQPLGDITTAHQKKPENDLTTKPCQKGEDTRSSDLCAQWYAADAANSNALATWVFGVFGILIGGITTVAAIKAALYAKRAAEATESALGIEQELRLSVIVPDGASVRHKRNKGLFNTNDDAFTLRIVNSGRGEANLLRVYRRWAYVLDPIDLPQACYPPEIAGQFDEHTDMIVGPTAIEIASYSEQRAIPPKPQQMIIYGWLEYRSRATGRIYVTGYAYAYLPGVPARGVVAGWFGRKGGDYWFHREVADQ